MPLNRFQTFEYTNRQISSSLAQSNTIRNASLRHTWTDASILPQQKSCYLIDGRLEVRSAGQFDRRARRRSLEPLPFGSASSFSQIEMRKTNRTARHTFRHMIAADRFRFLRLYSVLDPEIRFRFRPFLISICKHRTFEDFIIFTQFNAILEIFSLCSREPATQSRRLLPSYSADERV